LFEVLTGFKFIAEIIKEYDENVDMSFELVLKRAMDFLPERCQR
jgi:hypothetical protein